jgi:ubiquinone/menaquinone biosynthesis C-methylase UbiE
VIRSLPRRRQFNDPFSALADSYAASRPVYPAAIVSWLATQCARRETAWDCATGNGQAAGLLAAHFSRVIATDASRKQIDAAIRYPGVVYAVQPAEQTVLRDHSIDLVTVAQALHWFDIPAFLAEAWRVLTSAGLLAVWSYEKCSTGDTAVDAVLQRIFDEVENYWPDERKLVVNRYRDIDMPGQELQPPAIEMTMSWTVPQMLGYLGTWSASHRYEQALGKHPQTGHEQDLRRQWGAGERVVHWPLTVRVSLRGAA